MASTANSSRNKWVKYCTEHAVEVCTFADSLAQDGNIVSVKDIGIPEARLRELKQHLETVIPGSINNENVLNKVCQFIAGKIEDEAPVLTGPSKSTKDAGRNDLRSLAAKKENKPTKRGSCLPCTFCVAYWTDRKDRLKAHMTKCKYGPNHVADDIIEASLEKLNIAKDYYAKNMYFNPRSFVKETYSREDVFNILINFGHCAVPEACENICKVNPVATNISGRTFENNNLTPDAVNLDRRQEEDTNQGSASLPDKRMVSSGERKAPVLAPRQTNQKKAPEVQLSHVNSFTSHLETTDANEPEKRGSSASACDPCSDVSDEEEFVDLIIQLEEADQLTIDYVEETPDTVMKEQSNATSDSNAETDRRTMRARPKINYSIDENVDEESHDSDDSILEGSPYSFKDASSSTHGKKSKTPEQERKYQYREGLKMKLSEAKFYDVPREFQELPIWNEVKAFLEMRGITGSLMRNHMGNNFRFLWKLGSGKMEVDSKDMNKVNIDNVIDFMKVNEMNFQTIFNYYKSLKLMFNYFLAYSNLYETDVVEYGRLQHVFGYFQAMGTGLSKTAQRQYMEKVANEDIPHLSLIHDMVDKFRAGAMTEMKKLERNPRILNRDLTAHMNRYIASEICFLQGHRPNVVENWTVESYANARRDSECKVTVEDENVIVCPVLEQNTLKHYMTQIVLRSRVAEFMELYFRYVRDPVVQRTNSQHDHVLLQYDGEPFRKISQGLVDLQRKHQLADPISVSTARKAIETHANCLDAEDRSMVSKFLHPSEQTRYQAYRKANYLEAAQAVIKINPLHRTDDSEQTGKSSKPSTPKKVRKVISDSDSDDDTEVRATPSKLRRLAGQGVQNVRNRNLIVQDGNTKSVQICEIDMDCRESEKREKIPDPFHVPLKNPPQAGKQRVMDSLIKKYGSMADAPIPSASQLVKKYGIEPWKKNSVNRALLWEKENDIHRDCAMSLIRKYCEEKKCYASEINLDNMQKDTLPKKYSLKLTRGKKISRKTVYNQIVAAVNLDASQRKPGDMSDGLLAKLIRTQMWRDIEIQGRKDKGRGVFSSVSTIKKGSIICDYHGECISAAEGQKRLNSYPLEDSARNYFLFGKSQGKSFCIDTSKTPCACHPGIPTTMGRIINHSATKPNLKSQLRVVDKKLHVIFVAMKDINPFTELLTDYGVRKAGLKIPGLQE